MRNGRGRREEAEIKPVAPKPVEWRSLVMVLKHEAYIFILPSPEVNQIASNYT